ncbi:MAG: hypothetical protein PHW04_05550 [Candidatus Wallbacteria bacterium]|nr:hypothetical protein [Candidatus Wallbacteria bacterium]
MNRPHALAIVCVGILCFLPALASGEDKLLTLEFNKISLMDVFKNVARLAGMSAGCMDILDSREITFQVKETRPCDLPKIFSQQVDAKLIDLNGAFVMVSKDVPDSGVQHPAGENCIITLTFNDCDLDTALKIFTHLTGIKVTCAAGLTDRRIKFVATRWEAAPAIEAIARCFGLKASPCIDGYRLEQPKPESGG